MLTFWQKKYNYHYGTMTKKSVLVSNHFQRCLDKLQSLTLQSNHVRPMMHFVVIRWVRVPRSSRQQLQ